MAYESGIAEYARRVDAQYRDFRSIRERDVVVWRACDRWPLDVSYIGGLALCQCEDFPEYDRTFARPLLMFTALERRAREIGIRRGYFDEYLAYPDDYVIDIADTKVRGPDGYAPNAISSMRVREWRRYAEAVINNEVGYPVAGMDKPGELPPLNVMYLRPMQRVNA